MTHQIDDARVIPLHGTTTPLAKASEDRGAVPDSLPAQRILLILNRPAERQAALDQFLRDVHTPGSPSYHQWLTPAQFGLRFGAGDEDLATLSQWLGNHGFQITKLARSRQFLEFSGTAGQISAAFHTVIHQYGDEGQPGGVHYANAAEVQIPEALAPLVRGVAPMNNFRAEPQLVLRGRATYSRRTGKATALWTQPNPFGTANPDAYLVTPEDWATQYDLSALYQAGVNGAGETIGIINESNIDLGLVQAYQSLFGVSTNLPQVVIDGNDPGTINGVDTEAYLDVELAGALAPKAAVNLYIADAGTLLDPLELAAVRAVEDNQASVLSLSFGACEIFMSQAGNQFWAQLWQQAAAQGQTVLVSSGDTGPACRLGYKSANGLASTPWNVAVGGTDFYYADYATGGASTTDLWNAKNDASLGSLKAPLPEQGWSDAFGRNVIADGWDRREYYAGGGGPSTCATSNENGCIAGYAKPAWQSGPGVPADGVRDTPDVSLYASNGANLSAIPICAFAGQCAAGSGEHAEVTLTGGTSASAPAMAAIMALVNQKWGRQGQANNVLYALAQQKPAAFHDITLGGNQTVCDPGYWTGCTKQSNGHNGTPEYMAAPGYDMATGLGSVDANALVNNWNAITFKPTTTTLQVSSAKVTHGAPLTLTVSVAGGSNPTGSVTILTNSTLPASRSQTVVSLVSGQATLTTNTLPGGDYQLTASYGGDAVNAASTSSPVEVKIAAEPSRANLTLTSGSQVLGSSDTVQYNQPFQVNLQPTPLNAPVNSTSGPATGIATFTLDSIVMTVPLNVAGIASWMPPALLPGLHTISATYSGDASYQSSSAAAQTFTVAQGTISINGDFWGAMTWAPNNPNWLMAPGSSLTFGITAQPGWSLGASPSQIPDGTLTPTGTVTLCLTKNPNIGMGACPNPSYTLTVPLTAATGPNSIEAVAVGTFTNVQPGWYMAEAQYNGDSIYRPYGLIILNEIDVDPLPALIPTTTDLTVTPTTSSGNDWIKVTTTVHGSDTTGMTAAGWLYFYSEGRMLTYYPLPTPVAGNSASATFQLSSSWFWNSGTNDLTAVYVGDGATFGPSVSETVSVTVTKSSAADFTLAPQLQQIVVKSGSSATAGLNLRSLSGLNGNVSLSCTPSSAQFTCSITPGTLALNGTATATLTITAKIPSASPAAVRLAGWPIAFVSAALMLLIARRRRVLQGLALLVIAFAGLAAINGCGSSGNSGGGNQPPPNGTPAGLYNVVVTGTANGVVHNIKLTVLVQ